MKLLRKNQFLKQIKSDKKNDANLLDVQGIEYFRNKIFSSLMRAIIIFTIPIFIYGMYLFIKEGHYVGAIGNFLGLVLLLLLSRTKVISEKKRKIIIILAFYLLGLFILILTGSSGSGFVLVFWALILGGFFLDEKVAWPFIVLNILAFIGLTIGLFAGIFDDKAVALLKPTWLINVYIIQLYGMVLFLLMNIMFEGLKKQASHIKAANVKVVASQKRYKEMVANVVDVIVIADSLGIIQYISPNVRQLFGWESGEVLNRSLVEKIYQDDRHDTVLGFRKFLKDGERKKIIKLRHPCKNGEVKDLEVTLTNLLEDPLISGVLINFHDVTEKRHYQKKITYLNDHDELTGLYNRAYFNKVKQEIDCKENYPLSLVAADIDGLKIINDSFGHQAGDFVLNLAATCFKNFFRETDTIARIGGDEFCMILPRTSQVDAYRLIDRITSEIACYNEENQDQAHYLSISMGLASKNTSDDTFDAILHEADQKMYQTKNKKKADLNARIMEKLKEVLYNKVPDLKKKGQRCFELSRQMGQAMGLGKDNLKRLELLATLGEVGKIMPEETSLVKDNPSLGANKEKCRCAEDGYRIARAVPGLSPIAECILAHQEKWDGSGYPKGLKNEEIPLLARIRSLAVFYQEIEAEEQEELQKAEKIAALKAAAGTKHDPRLVNVLISIL